MDIQPFYFEQYKMLREEIMFSMGQIYSTETYGGIAVAGVYAWLLVNASRISVRAVWFIPPFLIVVCAVHCLILSLRLSMIGGYLKDIEEVAFGLNAKVPGWEHYKLSHGWVETSDFILASVTWVFASLAAIAVSWWGATRQPPSPPASPT